MCGVQSSPWGSSRDFRKCRNSCRCPEWTFQYHRSQGYGATWKSYITHEQIRKPLYSLLSFQSFKWTEWDSLCWKPLNGKNHQCLTLTFKYLFFYYLLFDLSLQKSIFAFHFISCQILLCCYQIVAFLTPEIGSVIVTEHYFRTQIYPWNFKPSTSYATASVMIESNFFKVTITGWKKGQHQSCQFLSLTKVLEFKALVISWLIAQSLDIHL